METIYAVIGFILGISAFVANIMPTWLLAVLILVAAGIAVATYTSIYPIHHSVDYSHKRINSGTLFMSVVLYVLIDAMLKQYSINIEMSWMMAAWIGTIGLAASLFTWLYLNYKHVATVRSFIHTGTGGGASNLNELSSVNLVRVQTVLDKFFDSKFKAFTKLDSTWTHKLPKLHNDHRDMIMSNDPDIIRSNADILNPEIRGAKGERAEIQPMFGTATSNLYPKYDRTKEAVDLEAAWLYCLHTNTVHQELIVLLRRYLVLDASYFKGTVFYIMFCWPVVLLRFVLGDFILRLKDYFFRISARLMNSISQAFTSRM